MIVGIFLWMLIAYLTGDYSNFFEAGFIIFHKLIFPNQSKFEMAITFPYDDNLILILESAFFESIALVIVLRFIIALLAIYSILYLLQSYLNRRPLKQGKTNNATTFA